MTETWAHPGTSLALEIPDHHKLGNFICATAMLGRAASTSRQWQSSFRFASLILGGAVLAQRFMLPNISGITRREQSVVRRKNESDDHIWLKFTAYKWLLSIGARPKYEVHYGPCIGDVYADDLKMIVECGDSDPWRLGAIFYGGLRFVSLPYQDDIQTKPNLDAFLFTASPECCLPELAVQKIQFPLVQTSDTGVR